MSSKIATCFKVEATYYILLITFDPFVCRGLILCRFCVYSASNDVTIVNIYDINMEGNINKKGFYHIIYELDHTSITPSRSCNCDKISFSYLSCICQFHWQWYLYCVPGLNTLFRRLDAYLILIKCLNKIVDSSVNKHKTHY